jgi:hypothetical protein
MEAKLAYIQLNSQTACPPRAAVPVNQGRCRSYFTRNTWIAFGHGCDHSSYVQAIYKQKKGTGTINDPK